MLRSGLLALACWGASIAGAQADARFVLESIDDPGRGLLDPREVAPVGGNTGTTLGEQRRSALEHALSIWGAALDSTVDIHVAVRFDDFPCDDPRTLRAAQANPSGYSRLSGTPGADPEIFYVSALANPLAGRAFDPADPEIITSFNGALDDGRCGFERPFYYGLDGAGGTADMVEIMLHEMAHGLGMATLLDPRTGALPDGFPDAFTARIFDNVFGKPLTELDDAERLESLTHVRALVFDGPALRAAAAEFLDRGVWEIEVSPAVDGFSGAIGRTNFGLQPLPGAVRGELQVGALDGGCLPPGDFEGRVLLVDPNCREPQLAADAEVLGARALLLVGEEGAPWSIPPLPLGRLSTLPIRIPVVTVARPDALALAAAAADGPVMITLRGETARLIGTDELGLPFLGVTDRPERVGISHFDPMLSPDALMEPSARARPSHELDLTLALLRDLGWAECGNGVVEPPEDCDEAGGNADDVPDACRTSCRAPACGDGVVDEGEACDEGERNSQAPDASCRLDCRPPSCGDGVVDEGEACDGGEANSDTEPDACRLDCSEARCGDGVVDSGEDCERGGFAGCSASCELAHHDAGEPDAGCDGGDCRSERGRLSDDRGGCGCRVGGSEGPPAWSWWGLSLALAARVVRRARRRS